MSVAIGTQRGLRARLLFVILALATTTLAVASAGWYWLHRASTVLESLHQRMVVEVNRSHELTRQSAIFTTSAPFLLNHVSAYLVESEGARLVASVDTALKGWGRQRAVGDMQGASSDAVVKALESMREELHILIEEARALAALEDAKRLKLLEITRVDQQLTPWLPSLDDAIPPSADALGSVVLQRSAGYLRTAALSENQLSLGENRRFYLSAMDSLEGRTLDARLHDVAQRLDRLSVGDSGLFALRTATLAKTLEARRALAHISQLATALNEEVLDVIRSSEAVVDASRAETAVHLERAQILMLGFAAIAVALALLASHRVSGQIVRRLGVITQSLTSLADGDMDADFVPPIEGRRDEIGRLESAYRVFRGNALALAHTNRDLALKTALFESVFDNISDGVATSDASGGLLVWNGRLSRVLSRFVPLPELVPGMAVDDVLGALDKALERGQDVAEDPGHRAYDAPDGRVLEVRRSALPDGGAVWLFSDTSQRRRVEQRLQQVQRLESLGRLTGEVAHDFNNVLTTIAAAVPRLQSGTMPNHGFLPAVQRIEHAVELGGSLTERLLAFSRRQRLEPKRVELNELVVGVHDLIALSVGDSIRLETRLGPDPVHVTIDPLQLESALLNLSLNSARAIDTEGRVLIAVECDGDDQVTVSVTDDGCGMSAAVARRAVEPFFTTGGWQGGSGLGLSIVYGFVIQSGGEFALDSAPGAGTRVSMRFGLADLDPVDAVRTDPGPRHDVLVVEDDAATLSDTAGALRRLGHRVHEAIDVAHAERLLGSCSAITCVLSDLNLGAEDSGWVLARIALERFPAVVIVVTSGNARSLHQPPSDLVGRVHLLDKPCSEATLAGVMAALSTSPVTTGEGDTVN